MTMIMMTTKMMVTKIMTVMMMTTSVTMMTIMTMMTMTIDDDDGDDICRPISRSHYWTKVIYYHMCEVNYADH